MSLALDLARKAAEEDEVPIGAVVVREHRLIGWGHNQTIGTTDPSAHAEMLALRMAAQTMGNYRLVDSALYVTLEPCCMCFGAIVHARLAKVVFATADAKTGVLGSVLALHHEARLNHHTTFESGLMAEESRALLRAFFAEKRLKKAPRQND